MLICFVVILYTTNAVYPSPERYYINYSDTKQQQYNKTKDQNVYKTTPWIPQKLETCYDVSIKANQNTESNME